MKKSLSILLAGASLLAVPAHAAVVELRGSPASMVQQNEVARAEGYTFLRTPAQVQEFVKKERLVRVEGDTDLQVAPGVSFPYARPAVALFLNRISAQYRDACGERLVVTSLMRPGDLQPANAHRLSVHPTGMAADLRISTSKQCRQWLESTLLELEDRGLLDITRERNPPHYHVAVFPEAYTAYVNRMRAEQAKPKPAAKPAPVKQAVRQERVAEKPENQGSRKAPLVVIALVAGALIGHTRRRGR